MSILSICQYINLAIIFSISFPIFIYSLQLLYQHRHKEWIRKRHKSVSIATMVLLFSHLFVLLPIRIYARFYYGFDERQWPLKYSHLDTVTIFTQQSLLVVYAMRVWLLYFDSHYSQALSSKEWSALINPKIFETNWFIANKHIYGNTKNISLPTFVITAILTTIVVSLHVLLYPSRISVFIRTFAGLLTLCFSYRIWKSFPVSEDAYGIQYELRYVVKRIAVLLVFFIISNILSTFDIRFIAIANLCIIIGYAVVGWSVVGIPTFYNEISNQNKTSKAVIHIELHGREIECISWRSIIRNTDGFNAFMEFLQTQFMTQNLLFITEYAQLIKVMSNQQIFIDLCDNTSLHFRLFVSNQLPLSTIIDQFDKESAAASNQKQIIIDCFVQTVNKLYLKYIVSTAPLVLDICDELKGRLDAWFIGQDDAQAEKDTDVRCIDVLECFQDLLTDNEIILNESYNQFRRSDIAHALVAFFAKNPRSSQCSVSSSGLELPLKLLKKSNQEDLDGCNPASVVEEDRAESVGSANKT
eukprot:951772_1